MPRTKPSVGAHGHSTNLSIAKQLLHFAGHGHFLTCRVGALNGQGVINLGKLTVGKLDVYNGANDLSDVTNFGFFSGGDHACAYVCESAINGTFLKKILGSQRHLTPYH
jgi:hypothetical protein